MTQSIREALFTYEKRKSNLLYVPRYNFETDSFETFMVMPNAMDALGVKDDSKVKA